MGSGGYSAWLCRRWGWYSVAETAYHRLQGTDSWAKLRGHIASAILPSIASQPLRMMHRCVSAPSCCTFILKAAFQEVSEHRILIKSGPGNWSLSASGTTHKATYRISP